MKTVIFFLLVGRVAFGATPIDVECEFSAHLKNGGYISEKFETKTGVFDPQTIEMTSTRSVRVWAYLANDYASISVSEGDYLLLGADSSLRTDGDMIVAYSSPRFDPDVDFASFFCQYKKD